MPVEDTGAGNPPAAAVAADASAAAAADAAEHQCRFCLETGRVVASASATAAATTADVGDDDALVAPCRCEGSQRFVHLSCLRRWQHTLVVDKVPMAERGGIARMLAHLITPAGAGAAAGGGGGGGRTDADCYGDARSAVCQVCRTPFTIPPPTRYDLLRHQVGSDAAGLIRAGGMLVKSQERSDRMQTLLESNAPLVPPRRAEAEAEAAAQDAANPQEAEEEAEAEAAAAAEVAAPSVDNDEEEEEEASSEDNDAAAAAAAAPAPGEGDPQRARTAAAIAGVLRMLFETRVGHWTKAAYLILWVGEEDDVGPAARQPEEEEGGGGDASEQAADGGLEGGDALAGVAAVQRRKAEKALRTKVVGVNLCRFESEGPVVKIREAAKEDTNEDEQDEAARRVVGRLRIRKFTGGPVEPSVRIGLCRLRGGAPGSRRAALLAPEKLWEAGLRTLPDALGSVALCGELSVLCDVLNSVLSKAPLVPEDAGEVAAAAGVTVTPPPAVEEVAVNAYAGRAVWNETQLLGEMSRGDWGVTQALPGDLWPPQEVAGAGAETVWERIQRDEGRLSAVHWPKKNSTKNGGSDGAEAEE